MEPYKLIDREDDWSVLVTLFPEGWQAKAHELGALQRCRKFLKCRKVTSDLVNPLGRRLFFAGNGRQG